MKNKYEVVVGNVGIIYTGSSHKDAIENYNDYCKLSDDNYGRAANELVTMFTDDELTFEHYPLYKNLAETWIKENTTVRQNQCINPKCKNPDVRYSEEQYRNAEIVQQAKCHSCGSGFVTAYRLKGIVFINLNQE